MAIQQVGGRGVYVITGSGRDPRKTSNGQSWADLVTQQKYMLLKEAKEEALRQIEQEQLSFEDRQRRQEQLRKNLLKQIDAERDDINKLRLEELTINEARERQNQRQANRLVGGSTGGGGPKTSTTISIPSEREIQKAFTDEIKFYQNEERKAQATKEALLSAQAQGQQYAEIAPNLLSPQQLQDLPNFETAIAKQDEIITNSRTKSGELATAKTSFTDGSETYKREVREQNAKESIRTSSGGGGSRGGGAKVPAPKLEEFKLTPEIERRQERIRNLQAELDALEIEERPQFDTIERTRDVYQEKFGEQPRRRLFGEQPRRRLFEKEPAPAPAKQNKMDALGMDDFEFQPSTVENVTQRSSLDDFQFQPSTVEQQSNIDQMSRYGNQNDMLMTGGSNTRILPARRAEMDALGMDDFEFQPSTVENVTQRSSLDDFQFQPSIVENVTQPTVQLKPMQTEIGDALRAQAQGTDVLEPRIQPQQFIEDMLPTEYPQAKPKIDYGQAFLGVQYGTATQKQRRAVELLIDASERFGPTSPEYDKAKQDIMLQLQKTLDPKQFRMQRKVDKTMEKSPRNYMALSKLVRGLSTEEAQAVMQLFPITSDMDLEEIDTLYKNAKREIETNANLNTKQRKKALEFLELQYLAVMDDYNKYGK